ncbi:hypothetical protein AAL_01472 [Moelleriella libera RCEF 2490]|uniref:Serine/threonine protein phosphatase n=1 Tax=Moelleriella libera RCEF 2490 TaxID=1081109 RepID=A0A166U750_9HYPO|nr:hypothetical protein AAL_01472 [Moelleriella libera RCEF 2490]
MATRAVPSKPPKGYISMDPNCAICRAPASMACECEARGLSLALQHAEDQVMRSKYDEIRAWVRGHAQDYILQYFTLLTERRKKAHSIHLDQITAHAFYHYNAPPHPNQIADAQAALKCGIDEDWQASVQRYPEVLQYFFSLVDLTLPDDHDVAVKDPPLSALNGRRKTSRRGNEGGRGTGERLTDGRRAREAPGPAPFAPSPYSGRDPMQDRRVPMPTSRRQAAERMPPPSNYYGGYA